jgi:hypothetical protein
VTTWLREEVMAEGFLGAMWQGVEEVKEILVTM